MLKYEDYGKYLGNVEGVSELSWFDIDKFLRAKISDKSLDAQEKAMFVRIKLEIDWYSICVVDRLKNCQNCIKTCKGHAEEPELYCWKFDPHFH